MNLVLFHKAVSKMLKLPALYCLPISSLCPSVLKRLCFYLAHLKACNFQQDKNKMSLALPYFFTVSNIPMYYSFWKLTFKTLNLSLKRFQENAYKRSQSSSPFFCKNIGSNYSNWKQFQIFKIAKVEFKVTVRYGLWEKAPICDPLISNSLSN